MIRDVSLIRYGDRVERSAVRRDTVVINRHPTPDDKSLLGDVVMNQVNDVLYNDPNAFLKGAQFYDVEVIVKVAPRRSGLDGAKQYSPYYD